MDSVETVLRVIVGYTIFVILLGVFGNLFALIVCWRPKLRKVPTFVFYAFLLISDTITLFWWNVDHLTLIYGGFLLEDLGESGCKTFTFFQMFSFQWSAWLLVTTEIFEIKNTIFLTLKLIYFKVSMTVERYLSIIKKMWRSTFLKPKLAFIVSIAIGTVLLIINVVFSQLVKYEANDYSNITCFGAQDYATWMQV